MSRKDFMDALMFRAESDGRMLTKREEACEAIMNLREDGINLPDDMSVEDFMEEWNLLVCVCHLVVCRDGEYIDRVDAMSVFEIARAIEEYSDFVFLDDLFDYACNMLIDKEEAAKKWARDFLM